MTKPEAYGPFHLGFFIGGLFVCGLLVWLLKKSSEKTFRRVLLGCGIFLMLSEVYKQLFYTFYIYNVEYRWWIFPFQLCSIPMYLSVPVGIIGQGKVRRACCEFMLAYNLMGGFVAFIEPSGLVHEYWTLTLHAFIWHMLLVFIGLYIGATGHAGKSFKDFLPAAAMFVCLCGVAFIINLILWKPSGGTINMFYVGPDTSPIIVFKTISEKFGWYVNTPIYMLCLTAAAFVFYLPFVIINRKKSGKGDVRGLYGAQSAGKA